MVLAACVVGLIGVGAAGTVRDRILARSAPGPTAAVPAPVAAAVTGPAAGQAGAIALQADGSGHFHTAAVVDGRVLRMVVDTGATLCAFSEEDAARAGITVAPAAFTQPIATANGTVRVAPVRIGAIQVGAITVRDVEAVIVPRGRLSTNLLGMSFLKRVRGFEIAGGTLTLRG
ncbi:TIGR02281 family clan AA aspartic protease [Methylobacterium sp. NEAU 140]|uniref:retropepsin-like aspartic protease family protein n=1 Tax=Methylobacterium sp. NEAU 140 TaxID=3064945 RepID=UPI00273347A5|nr:TIGR02281 family clan AA aspartic protease [Methylobacterium sp. NEAU 140]MDP4023949.1 TIGR02281 family clan AA aspartic protease [Methylobacterium sp. NEAU 140]